ncbi:MAG TPA: DUF4097 family beta strand repeat-containing protein [Gemmatimonadaceae bacterium]|jgi:hypothetical protein
MTAYQLTRCLLGTAFALGVAGKTLEAQRTIEIRRAVTSTPSIRISGAFAELNIHGWKKDSAAITGTIPSDARFDGGFVTSSTPSTGAKYYMETASGVPSGKLDLYVPTGARVWAKSGSAKIEVEGMTGGLDLNIIGGSVHVRGNPHELTVESMDGSVTVDGSPPWTRLKTATGDIALAGNSDDAGLTTVSGTIRVVSGRFERARLESVTGAVDFAGDVEHGGSLDVDTHSGSIDLRLSPKMGADFDVASVAGTIENTLTNRPAVPGREGRGQETGFTTGGGGARVYIRSFKGNIRLQPWSKISTQVF